MLKNPILNCLKIKFPNVKNPISNYVKIKKNKE